MGRQLFKQGYCSTHILRYQFFKKNKQFEFIHKENSHLIIYIIDVDL